MRRRSKASSEPTKARRSKAKTLNAARQHSSSPAGQETEVARLTRELRESLEQQTATGDVLKVISRSAFDLPTVLDTLVKSAARLCDADHAWLFRRDGEVYRWAASYGHSKKEHDRLKEYMLASPFSPGRGSAIARALLEGRPVQIADVVADPDYDRHDVRRIADYRTALGIPLLREGIPVGVMALTRSQPRIFTGKQIELLITFADQAVIAIENTRLLNELRQRTTDLAESLEQQTATSEVLQVISSSTGKLEPVFDVMVANATRICEARFGTLYLRDGDGFRAVAATRDAPPAYVEARKRRRLQPAPDALLRRAAIGKQVVQIADLRELESYHDRHPFVVEAVELGKFRTALGVPLLKDDELIGVITIMRQEVRPFTDKQIELVQNFAAQAVIAIENARLLNELRQRTTDLTESLEQQTATSEVLNIISRSPAELEPVFQAILANATRLCGAKFGILNLYDDEVVRRAASYNVPPEYADMRLPWRPHPGSGHGEVARTKQPVHFDDLRTSPAYLEGDSNVRAAVDVGGVRTLLVVPMLKDGVLIGAISIYRQEVRPFADKQIELVKNFAAQAVIAIENARLLNELRESLQQQTATAEVLRVISSSPGELEPVFQNLLDNATRLCAADFGLMARYDGSCFQLMAQLGGDRDYVEYLQREPFHPGPETLAGRVLQTRGPVQIEDFAKSKGYLDRDPLVVVAVERGGVRTTLGVPMLRENELIGVISIYRKEVRPFTDKQIELLQNFAAQAVIAIENARLLNELRESLEQQTATSEVLKVISSSPTNIQPVLEIIGERAEKLCEADISVVSIVEGELIRLASIRGVTEAGEEATRRAFPHRLTDETVTARAIRTRSVCHVADVLSDPQYQLKHTARLSETRGSLGVPMIRDEQVVGAIFVARRQPGLFSDAQVQLLKTFADQAVIAIENVRLFNETKNSLEQQTATADVLKIISRSAFDLRAVLQTLVESAARFCAADTAHIIREKNGGFYTAEAYGYSREFMDYIKNILIKPERGTASGRALAEGRVVHIADVKTDTEYTLAEAQRLGDYRTVLCVPMLREGVPIGVLSMTRSEVQPFTDKQIELVTTFTDQAAIAIENVRLFDEIQDKSRQLEEASQHKSQFLANMSHELRTPLNAILGYTELMADGAYGEPSEKMLDILKRLEANGKHLLGLINDVLDLSKIEAGQLVLELSDYCIQDIAQTVRSTLEPLAADKKLAFKVEVAPQLPPGHGDGRRLTQVLINLVGNAIKFTDTGEVAIKAEANNGSFHVSVRDTGPGISSADQARLFQEFQQADNAITKKKGGTGLGLAISKRIIEMHGGRIWVESQPGQGSTFTFTLPVIVERQVEAA
jgi:GAF domain-containing protein